MGCGSNNEDKKDENEEIKNYDERDNFYTFYRKKNGKILPPSNKKENEKEKNNENNSNKNSDEDNKSSENEDNNKATNKKGDLDRINSNKERNNNNNNKDNSKNKEENPYLEYMNKKKKKLNEDEENEKESSHIFKNIPEEMNYYSKKLKSKKKGNIDHDSNYSKVMYDYKNIFTETGEKIPEYKIYAKNKKEKNKFCKKTKLNGVIIVEDLKDYFPQDITRDEIQELIFEAFGECIVDDEDLLIPGQTATYDQVLELSDYVFNFIKGNEKKLKENRALQKLNVKIDLVSLDKNLIKDKLYKGKEPSENQLDSTMRSYKGIKKEVKVLSIEFL